MIKNLQYRHDGAHFKALFNCYLKMPHKKKLFMYVVGLNAKDMILMYMAHSVVKTCIFIQSKNGEKSREQPWRNLIDTIWL